MKRWLLMGGRVVIAGIFLYAGYEKVREPWLQFAVSVESFKAVADSWIEPIARILPWGEIALAIALLSGIWARWFSLIATLLLGLFLSVGIRASVLGLSVDCGCFGAGHSGAIDATWFAEHAAMFALGAAVTIGYFLMAGAPKRNWPGTRAHDHLPDPA